MSRSLALSPPVAGRRDAVVLFGVLGLGAVLLLGLRLWTPYSLHDGEGGEEDTADQEDRDKWQRRALATNKRRTNHVLEICCSDYASAVAAVQGGATSLELCSNRLEGGVTPSIAFVQAVVDRLKSTDVLVNVLVRPRPGGFCYTPNEFEIILHDILQFRSCGVDGVVVGLLDASGGVDVQRMRVVREYSDGLMLTFHRAFDVMTTPLETDYRLIMHVIGCDRLLSSGRSSSACSAQGSDTLARLAALDAPTSDSASPKLTVAAAGISEANVAALIRNSGVRAVHLGSAVCAPVTDDPSDSRAAVAMGKGSQDQAWDCVQASLVEAVVVAAGQSWGSGIALGSEDGDEDLYLEQESLSQAVPEEQEQKHEHERSRSATSDTVVSEDSLEGGEEDVGQGGFVLVDTDR